MKKINILSSILLFMLLPVATISAKENTAMETFIQQVRETNTFVPVSNIWQADNNFDKTELLQNVTDAMPLMVDYNTVAGFIKQNNTAISLVVPGTNGTTYTIDLAQYNFLGNNFEVHAMGNNADGICNYTPGLYYRGVVNGIPGSVAAFSFFKNEIYGVFSIPNIGNFVLVPNTMVGEYYNYNQHYILYNDRDLKKINDAPGCATDKLPTNYLRNNQRTTTTLSNNVYNNCLFVKVFEVADNACYIKKGNSTTNVTNYLTALFNNQSTLYRNEGVPIVLSYVQIDTVSDVYQGITGATSTNFLDKFGYTTQNTLHGCDVAILISTRFNGNMGGVAWLQSACSGYYAPDSAGPYAFCNINNSTTTSSTAFPTYSWDVEVITHEMGHTVGSPHTHACCWNPPARNTAIDACYTLEGSCATPSPAHPPGGGTIMSYCHLTSVGINFSLGFGQQPGDTIRYYIYQYFSASCGLLYYPATALSKVSRTISANRECTDLITGTTYYWNDNNTAVQTDDTLVLMIKKNGNNIGNLNTTGFSVTANTVANYGAGLSDTISFPTGVTGLVPPNYGMRRFWKINATTAPTTAVEVIFPFLAADSSDIDGSAPGHPHPTGYKMYKVNSPVNPNPLIDSFRYTTAATVSLYSYATTPSTTKWSLSQVGNTYLAHMQMINLSGGGSGFYDYNPAGTGNVALANAGINIYPNPTSDQWFVSVDNSNNGSLIFQLYAADGRIVSTQTLQSGSLNTISAQNLPTGVYFYRITNNSKTFSGNLVKR